MSPLGPTWPATLTEPPARTRPLRTVSTWLVPLPHRPPLDTRCTLQVPSNCAGSARAEPDRITPTVRPIAATARVTLLVKVGIVTSPCFQPYRLKQSGPPTANQSAPRQCPGQIRFYRGREPLRVGRAASGKRTPMHGPPATSITRMRLPLNLNQWSWGGRLMRALVMRRTARLDRF